MQICMARSMQIFLTSKKEGDVTTVRVEAEACGSDPDMVGSFFNIHLFDAAV
jgi:hypothetical protein